MNKLPVDVVQSSKIFCRRLHTDNIGGDGKASLMVTTVIFHLLFHVVYIGSPFPTHVILKLES